jgi:hypothetical protein
MVTSFAKSIDVLCPIAHRGTLVVLLGRTVSRIVTRWFVLGHERERDKRISAGSGRFEERNTLFLRMTLYMSGVTGGVYRAVRC